MGKFITFTTHKHFVTPYQISIIMYPETIVAPMREELTSVGFQELKTPEAVQNMLQQKGACLVVVNSICGCAAGNARPGVKAALLHEGPRPDHLYTVFAGVDIEAVEEVRRHTAPYPPSSPSIGLFVDGKLVAFIERLQIEGNNASAIAQHLVALFQEHLAA